MTLGAPSSPVTCSPLLVVCSPFSRPACLSLLLFIAPFLHCFHFLFLTIKHMEHTGTGLYMAGDKRFLRTLS